MRVLDLDLDYFLDEPVHNVNYSSNERVTDEACVKSVWSEARVRDFLENNLKLSKDRKVEGRVLKGHDEALYFWEELLKAKKLDAPFSIIHVDSHADLSYGDVAKSFVLNDLIFWKPEIRNTRHCAGFEIDGVYHNIGIGNYLLFAIAFGWVADLIYCANPNCDPGDIPREILSRGVPAYLSQPYDLYIKLQPSDDYSDNDCLREPVIPLRIIPQIEYVQNDESFDFINIAQSPNYTPENADYILDIVREYITEI